MPPEDEATKAEPKVAKAETEDTKGWLERLAAITKELFGVLREVSIPICIALFVFLLLFWPETVKDRLHRAGITEVAGVHFDANQLDMAVKQTGDAQQQVAEIKQNVETTKRELDELHAQPGNPEVQKKIEAISAKLNTSLQTLQSAEQGLRVSRQTQENILQQAAPVATPALSGSWGVVVSGDKQMDTAMDEVKTASEIAKDTGSKSVALYDRQGWLRTVVEFSSNTQAQAALPTLQQQKNQRYEGAYVVNIDEWCPNRQQQQGAPVTLYKCP